MPPRNGHPLFARFWDFATRHEGRRERAARKWVMAGAKGHMLELGVGVGTNWEYLPARAHYKGIEPDQYMLERAYAHAAEQGREVDLHRAGAESLPFDDAVFDTVMATLTLCTVQDLERSLAEAMRVLKPGGELRLWEHVRPKGRVTGPLFDGVTPLWSRIGAGCHPNRRTLEAVKAAGFEVREARELRLGPLPTVRIVAAKPAAAATLNW